MKEVGPRTHRANGASLLWRATLPYTALRSFGSSGDRPELPTCPNPTSPSPPRTVPDTERQQILRLVRPRSHAAAPAARRRAVLGSVTPGDGLKRGVRVPDREERGSVRPGERSGRREWRRAFRASRRPPRRACPDPRQLLGNTVCDLARRAARAVGFTPCGVQLGLNAWSHAEMRRQIAEGVRTSAEACVAMSSQPARS